MSRATVRAAIQSYLQGANITSLGTVYAHPPKYAGEEEFYLNESFGAVSGAVIFIYLQHHIEERAALGGPTSGEKFRHYRCILLCILKSKEPSPEVADADNDAFLDSLIAAIQGNRTAGAAATVFQWGEGDTLYGPDISVYAGMPRTIRGQSIQVFSRVEVSVLEEIST